MKKIITVLVLHLFFTPAVFALRDQRINNKITATCDSFSYSQPCDASTSSSQSSQSGFFTQVSNQTQFPYSQQSAYNQERLNNLAAFAYLKAAIGEARFQEFKEQSHFNFYGCNADYLNNILHDYSFERLEKLMIQDKKLTKLQALNVWKSYCNKRCCHGKQKSGGYDRITKEYDRREKAEIKKQAILEQENAIKQDLLRKQQAATNQANIEKSKQETKILLRQNIQKEFVQNYLKKCGLDENQCVYLPKDFEQLKKEYELASQFCKEKFRQENCSPVWAQRLYALKKTDENGFAQSMQEITLSPKASGYLLANDLQLNQYQSCYGTEFQQQLYLELCNSFELIAQAQSNFLHQSSFLHSATACTDAGYFANQFEDISLAMSLIDLSDACYKVGQWTMQNGLIYAKAMADGVVESVWDFAHMVTHPAELVQNISQAAWFVLDTMALADQDSIGASLPIAKEQLQERINTVSAAAVALQGSVINSTGPQRVKMATKFTADCIFMHKATQAVGAVAGVLRTQAGTIRTMEYATEIVGHEPAFASAAESISQATQELETFMQKSVAQELAPVGESLESVGVAAIEKRIVARSVAQVLSDIQSLGGKIPLSNVELCKEVKALVEKLVKEANVIIDTKLRQQFSSRWITENGVKKRVSMDLEHALNYEVKFKNNIRSGSLEIQFSGGHLAGSTEALAEKGLIKIINTRQLPTGCLEFSFESCITKQRFTKTEFPISWDEKTILKNSWDLFENPEIKAISLQEGKIGKIIKIEEKELTIVIKNHEKDINIVTVLPYIEN